MTRAVIVSAVRTPFGRLGGGLASYEATELGAIAIRAALERVGLEAQEPQYVIMGQVLQGGAGQAPARQAAIGAGLPKETPADTINKVCASSIRAVEIADSMIRTGDVDVRPAAHGPAELEGRARARHLPRAAGLVGRALARARGGRSRLRPLRRRDRRGGRGHGR